MWRGISLANKCLLLFGGAIVLIVGAALIFPFLRMNTLVSEGEVAITRRLTDVWITLDDQAIARSESRRRDEDQRITHGGIAASRMTPAEARAKAETDPWFRRAITRLENNPARRDVHRQQRSGPWHEIRLVRAVRSRQVEDAPIESIVEIVHRETASSWLLLVNAFYLVSAGSIVLGTAVLLFYFITHRLILSPVRSLRETADRVREGDLEIRSDISTGDEFEEMAETFNLMLEELSKTHDQLRAISAAKDVRLNELAESNMILYETAKLKGDFLASVSHELRTPLNSIVGFGELLLEIASAERSAGDDSTRLSKRIRYLEHIVRASRDLLEMITSLLEMAKIEAGRIEVTPEPMIMRDVCGALIGLMTPLADRQGIELRMEVPDDLPVIRTDIKKFQQIMVNLLSNAVKFTGHGRDENSSGETLAVTLRAELIMSQSGPDDKAERVRVSVIDQGPGIAPEDQVHIFEKFQQLDQSHTKEHQGTGLGLAISKELAGILQGEIQLVSDVGRGSMFSVVLPLELDANVLEETKLEAAFRATLAGRRTENE